MENVTKALIIAAAVLIAIVLVALGVLLLGNVSNTSEEANKVGDSVSLATDKAVDKILGVKTVKEAELRDWIEELGLTGTTINDKVFEDKVKMTGYVFQGAFNDQGWYYLNDEPATFPSTQSTTENVLNDWINEQLKNNNIKKIKNPDSKQSMSAEVKAIKEKLSYPEGIGAPSKYLYYFFYENDKVVKFVYILGVKEYN